MKISVGPRIAKGAEVTLGAAAVVWDARGRLLLTQRSDNRLWCLPGGRVDAGENLGEACLRELDEETGLRGSIRRLVGLYSSPDYVVVYHDGVRRQVVAAVFEVVPFADAILAAGPEVVTVAYFTEAATAGLDVLEIHRERVADAFRDGADVFIR